MWIINLFLDFSKEMKHPFLDQKSGLDFSKEMHPKFQEVLILKDLVETVNLDTNMIYNVILLN